jgi:hypothetical protein
MPPALSTSSDSSIKFPLVVFLLLGLAPLYWYMNKTHPTILTASERAADFTPGSSDWYFTVKLPEAPFSAAGAEDYKRTLAAWLAALQREGFHAMRLSDVRAHINNGIGLPDKTVVLMFEPGYANTFKMAAPILKWYRMPAVWITNAAAVKRSNRKYVSTFGIWCMRLSGLWDIGSYDQPGILTIQTKNIGKLTFGTPARPVWVTPGAMTYALNQSKSLCMMNRLKISSSWSDRELISRLLNEVPVIGTSQLSARQIGDRVWGTSIPGTSFTNALLSFKAPLDKRAVSISWPGTRGLNDFDLQLEASSLIGEMWLLLRSNREKSENVRVGFTSGYLIIETEKQGKKERLATITLSSRKRSFATTLSLHGDELKVLMDGNLMIDTHSIPTSSSKQAMLEMMIYNKIRGTASADGIRLIFNPQTPPAPAPPKA